jgi:hypothetical protein
MAKRVMRLKSQRKSQKHSSSKHSSSKHRASKHRASKHNNSRSKSKSHRKNMRGGDAGRYVLPPSYFGNGTAGYSATPSSANQLAVSQGVIHEDGKWAGPNLYPSQVGAGCGCNSNRKQFGANKSKSGKKYLSKTQRKTKRHH